MFRERKTFTLLSLLSALVVASTAFVGVSIYAQTGESELTTFEEEALAAGEQFEDTTSNATSDATDGGTSTADISFLEGLVVCDLGTAEVSGETEVASFDESVAPTVSVTVMSETEVAELSANETETASADSARCVMTDGGESDGNATGTADATPDAGGNATSTSATGDDNATSTSTSDTTTLGSDEEILVIEGQDFAPGQVVLMFTEDALVGIDDVDESGEIEAKIPVPGGETQVAGATELRFLESGTQRTATFEFDGETLTAAAGGDIEAEGGEDVETTLTPAPNNSTSNKTSSSNSTNATMQ